MKVNRNFIIFIAFYLALTITLTSPSFAQPKDPGKVYKVAILPFIIHSQENLDYLREGNNDILTSRITVEGRIIVLERTLVERILWEMRPMRLDEAVAQQVGSRAGADYVDLGSITKIGNYISLDARLISITEDKPPLAVYTQHKGIDDVMSKIGDFAQDIGFRILGRRAMTAGHLIPGPLILFVRRGISEEWALKGWDLKRARPSPSKLKASILAMWTETKRMRLLPWIITTSMFLSLTGRN